MAVPVLLAGCSAERPAPAGVDPQCAAGSLSGAGATFQRSLQSRWISDFTTRCHAASVAYDAVGSGGGIERFIAGAVDFAGSDALLTGEEQRAADARCARAATGPAAPGSSAGPVGPAEATAVHIPLVGGALVFLYNLPGVNQLRLARRPWRPSSSSGSSAGTTRGSPRTIPAWISRPPLCGPCTGRTRPARPASSGSTCRRRGSGRWAPARRSPGRPAAWRRSGPTA
ncbi:phosphate transport system substrate-binding protein [Frankia sp. Hr75.2]|nr:phosphate transport system substrate-binding protein [Frankia sp. Hr75.2]